MSNVVWTVMMTTMSVELNSTNATHEVIERISEHFSTNFQSLAEKLCVGVQSVITFGSSKLIKTKDTRKYSLVAHKNDLHLHVHLTP